MTAPFASTRTWCFRIAMPLMGASTACSMPRSFTTSGPIIRSSHTLPATLSGSDAMTFFEKHKVPRVLNALGTSTIVGANVAPPEVIAAVAEALAANCEIDQLQRAACRAIAAGTGAEAGCVTSSAASGIAISAAACMSGDDLSKIARLPDTDGLANEVVLQRAHD